jgi:bacterioferritin-associated ferredoxin
MDLRRALRHRWHAIVFKQSPRANMIICSCNVLSDKDVKSCMLEGCERAMTPAEVHERLGSTPQCGCCSKAIRSIVRTELSSAQLAD